MDVISTNEISKQTEIASGADGVIYKIDDDTVYKEFNSQYYLENKYNKILLLSELNIEGLVLPKKIVTDEQGYFSGYTMEYIETASPIGDFDALFHSDCTLAQKFNYLKQLEDILKKIDTYNCLNNESALKILDFNNSNFVINKEGKVLIVDIDSVKIGKCRADIPSPWYEYYSSNVSNDDEHATNYLFGLYTLYFFSNNPRLLDPNFSPRNEDEISNIINNLSVSDDIKNQFHSYFFNEGYKNQYIGDALSTLPTDVEEESPKSII